MENNPQQYAKKTSWITDILQVAIFFTVSIVVLYTIQGSTESLYESDFFFNSIVSLGIAVSFYIMAKYRRVVKNALDGTWIETVFISPITYTILIIITFALYYYIKTQLTNVNLVAEIVMGSIILTLFLLSLAYLAVGSGSVAKWSGILVLWGLIVLVTLGVAVTYNPNKTLAEIVDPKWFISVGTLFIACYGLYIKRRIGFPNENRFLSGFAGFFFTKEGWITLGLILIYILNAVMVSKAEENNEEPLVPDDWSTAILGILSSFVIYYIYVNFDSFDYKTSEGYPNDIFKHALDTLHKFKAIDPEFVKQALVREQSLQAKLGLPELDDCIPITEIESMCDRGDFGGTGGGSGSGIGINYIAQKLNLKSDEYYEFKEKFDLDDEEVKLLVRSNNEEDIKLLKELLEENKKPRDSQIQATRKKIQLNKLKVGTLPKQGSPEESAFMGYLNQQFGITENIYRNSLDNENEIKLLSQAYSDYNKLKRKPKVSKEQQNETASSLLKKNKNTPKQINNPSSEPTQGNEPSSVEVSSGSGISGQGERPSSVDVSSRSGISDQGERSSSVDVSSRSGISGQGERSLGSSLMSGIGTGAKAVGSGVATGVKAVGSGVASGAKAVGSGVATGAKVVGRGAKRISNKASNVGKGISRGFGELTTSPKGKTVDTRGDIINVPEPDGTGTRGGLFDIPEPDAQVPT